MRKNLLPLTFLIFTCCGFWRPNKFDSMTSKFRKYTYNTFTVFVTTITCYFTFSGIIVVAFEVGNVEELSNNLFMLLTMLNVCCKMITILVYRKDVFVILEILSDGFCKPRDSIERKIQNHFDRTIKFTTVLYFILTEFTVCLYTLRSLFELIKGGILPMKIWLPFDYTSSLLSLYLTFVHQMMTVVIGSLIQVATETLVSGLMMQISAQLNILKYRLSRIAKLPCVQEIHRPEETKDRLIECIRHHNLIFQLAEMVNRIFELVFFIQFSASSLVLCLSVYLLASVNFGSIPFMATSFYVACMLVQLFLFCWFGNEVILQSVDISDAAYNMNWTDFNVKEKKLLLNIMIRCMAPIKLNAFTVTLSIESYTSILKLSYSAYNVLQRSSE